MSKFFSTSFISFYYFNNERGRPDPLRARFGYVVVPKPDGAKLGKNEYTNIVNVMAYDFYKQARAYFPEFREDRPFSRGYQQFFDLINTQCIAITKLPAVGWNIEDYEIQIIKPTKHSEFIMTCGTNFKQATRARSTVFKEFAYKGAEFVQRLDELVKHEFTVATEFEGNTYYSILGVEVRTKIEMDRQLNAKS